MAQAQKPEFVFRRNGRVCLNRRGRQHRASFGSTTGSRGVRISDSNGSNAGYNMLRGSVKGTGYPVHSPVSPSLPLPCVTVCHHVSVGLYCLTVPKPTRLTVFSSARRLPRISCSVPLTHALNKGSVHPFTSHQ